MNDIALLLEIVAAIALVAAPPIILARLLAGDDGATLADLLAMPADRRWPRGVQEEEPMPWRVKVPQAPTLAGDHRPSGGPAVRLGIGYRARQTAGPCP